MNGFTKTLATSAWRPDGLFIEFCDLQLNVVVHWLLEKILRTYLIFSSVIFYSHEPANSPVNLLFFSWRTSLLISADRVPCLKVLTLYSDTKSFLHLAKCLAKHDFFFFLPILELLLLFFYLWFYIVIWKLMFKQYGTKKTKQTNQLNKTVWEEA